MTFPYWTDQSIRYDSHDHQLDYFFIRPGRNAAMPKAKEDQAELVEFARRSGVLDAYARDEVSAEQCDFCLVEGSAIAKN